MSSTPPWCSPLAVTRRRSSAATEPTSECSTRRFPWWTADRPNRSLSHRPIGDYDASRVAGHHEVPSWISTRSARKDPSLTGSPGVVGDGSRDGERPAGRTAGDHLVPGVVADDAVPCRLRGRPQRQALPGQVVEPGDRPEPAGGRALGHAVEAGPRPPWRARRARDRSRFSRSAFPRGGSSGRGRFSGSAGTSSRSAPASGSRTEPGCSAPHCSCRTRTLRPQAPLPPRDAPRCPFLAAPRGWASRST